AKTDGYASTLDKVTSALTVNTRAMVASNLESAGAFAAAQRLGIPLGLVTDAALGQADALAQVNTALAPYLSQSAALSRTGRDAGQNMATQAGAATALAAAIGATGGQIAGAV